MNPPPLLTNGMLPRMRSAFRWLTSVLFVAIVVQVGFAGYGAFDVIHKAEQASVSVPKKTIEDAFNAHSALGPIIVLLMLVLLIVSLAGRLGESQRLAHSRAAHHGHARAVHGEHAHRRAAQRGCPKALEFLP